MKIVIVSDSHGDTQILNYIRQKEYDADYFIHCGDFCLPEYMMNEWGYVLGNCDWGTDGNKFLNINTKIGLIHVEHGDNFKIMFNLEAYLKELGCKIFISGHTHIRKFKKYKGIYLINPGSLTRPRDSNFGSFLILNINEKNKKIVPHFYDVELGETISYKESESFKLNQ